MAFVDICQVLMMANMSTVLHLNVLQATLVMEAAKEANVLRSVEHQQGEAVHSAAEQLLDLEIALTQATAANADLAQYQKWIPDFCLWITLWISRCCWLASHVIWSWLSENDSEAWKSSVANLLDIRPFLLISELTCSSMWMCIWWLLSIPHSNTCWGFHNCGATQGNTTKATGRSAAGVGPWCKSQTGCGRSWRAAGQPPAAEGAAAGSQQRMWGSQRGAAGRHSFPANVIQAVGGWEGTCDRLLVLPKKILVCVTQHNMYSMWTICELSWLASRSFVPDFEVSLKGMTIEDFAVPLALPYLGCRKVCPQREVKCQS